MTRVLAATALALLLPAAAHAGKCDAYARKAASLKGEAVVPVFRDMLACDKQEAEVAYDSFMRSAGEVGAIVELSLMAIDAKVFTPVWNMMEKIPDYSARDEIAEAVGATCGENDQVVPFLQGAFYGLRAIQFGQWDDALVSCESDVLLKWLQDVVSKPPSSSYDEKYNAISQAFVDRLGPEALPVLEKAAVAAASGGGPFNAIIEKMDNAVQPRELGASISDEDRARLEASLIDVANEVGPEQAALVADRLYNAGAEAAAASLLPRVYPDRVQGNGALLYGVASVEACSGSKEAVIHVAEVTEPARRWSIGADVEAPARAFKPRLKCEAETPWPVLATPEPVASGSDVSAWGESLVQPWTDKGYTVKVRTEKSLALD